MPQKLPHNQQAWLDKLILQSPKEKHCISSITTGQWVR